MALALEGVRDVRGSDGLAPGMLNVGSGVAENAFDCAPLFEPGLELACSIEGSLPFLGPRFPRAPLNATATGWCASKGGLWMFFHNVHVHECFNRISVVLHFS